MRQPTLYKKTSSGALQEWTITTEENAIITRYGLVGGKIQTATDVVKEGKNAGKKNATTAVQQAEAEAMSQWEKKLKKGYVQTKDDAASGKIDSVIEGGIFPMLAHKFSEQGHKISYPALAQPKFDGHRCIGVVEGGKASLWTRGREPITGLPHIVKDIESFAKQNGIKDIILDGELYNHEYRTKFEELSSFIRNPEPKEGCEIVQYHIYDVADENLLQEERGQVLNVLGNTKNAVSLVAVQTLLVDDEDELMLAFENFLTQGYEGLMVRNAEGKYKPGKRSYDLQKVKKFEDAEFKVLDVVEGRGKLEGHAIFICATNGDPRMDPDATFRAKMKGKIADLKKFWDKPELAINRQLTVKFQGVTNKTKVPRFPVAERFRD